MSQKQIYSILLADQPLGFKTVWWLDVSFERIIDFGELPVFEQAATMPTIIVLRREKPKTDHKFYFTAPFSKDMFKQIAYGHLHLSDAEKAAAINITQNELTESNWRLGSTNNEALRQKLDSTGVLLEKYVGGKILYGIKTGLVEAFIIDEKTKDDLIKKSPRAKDIIKPYVVGDDVRKFHIRKSHRFIIYTYHGIDFAGCESVSEYLKKFKTKLEKRATKQEWYELQQPQQRYTEFYALPKIIYPDIAKESRFAFDDEGIYPADTTFVIPVRDLYLLGLLNSKLIFFYLGMVCPVLGDVKRGGRLRLKYNYVKQLPIRPINFNDPADKARHDKMVSLVERMLALHKSLSAARNPSEQDRLRREVESTDGEVDGLVYELYGLSEEEIRIVEG